MKYAAIGLLALLMLFWYFGIGEVELLVLTFAGLALGAAMVVQRRRSRTIVS